MHAIKIIVSVVLLATMLTHVPAYGWPTWALVMFPLILLNIAVSVVHVLSEVAWS